MVIIAPPQPRTNRSVSSSAISATGWSIYGSIWRDRRKKSNRIFAIYLGRELTTDHCYKNQLTQMEEFFIEQYRRMAIAELEEGNVPIEVNPMPNLAGALIGRLVLKKTIGAPELEGAMKKIWRLRGNLEVSSLDDGWFIFEFGDEEECKRINMQQPWNFNGSLLLLKKFGGFERPDKIELRFAPYWIQIHGLPYNLRTRQASQAVGSRLGKINEYEGPAQGRIWGSFLKVRVLLDVENPLCRGTYITTSGSKLFVALRYEKLGNFCYGCGKLNHMIRKCTLNFSSIEELVEKPRRYELWLKADGPKMPPIAEIERKLLEEAREKREEQGEGSKETSLQMLQQDPLRALDGRGGVIMRSGFEDLSAKEGGPSNVIRLADNSYEMQQINKGKQKEVMQMQSDGHMKVMGSFGRLGIREDLDEERQIKEGNNNKKTGDENPHQAEAERMDSAVPFYAFQASAQGITQKIGTEQDTQSTGSSGWVRRGRSSERGKYILRQQGKRRTRSVSSSTDKGAKKASNWELEELEETGEENELLAAVGQFQPHQEE